jgi:hypothetical protein
MSHPEKAASDRGLFFCGLACSLALLNRFSSAKPKASHQTGNVPATSRAAKSPPLATFSRMRASDDVPG